ncbi:unnamed protein product [Miscanthus lutarioriparius]|uniref:Uncharacterized protein n=1 Tax=Miscanthus lutarioriparius TaxID=422564 RepID=A0A811R3X1_9POAL|nr:unnamed protein product [Miscanthus lutarioriparius]
MATTPAGVRGGGEVSVPIPGASAGAAAGGELQQRERSLNRFVRAVAFWEWAGNAFGALAFLWATVVLLGGFCSDLEPLDFWSAMVIIFIEAFRIFSRNYKSDNQWLFGTTRALRWTNVSSIRMLRRPQEGNEVVLIMGLWIDLVIWLPVVGPMFDGILQVALLIVMSKMQLRGASQQTSRSQRCRRLLLLWAVLIAYIIVYALKLSRAMDDLEVPMLIMPFRARTDYEKYSTPEFELASASTELLTMVVAALLLISRPRIIAHLTSISLGRSLLSLAKLVSAISLVFGSMLLVWPKAFEVGDHQVVDPNSFIISLATMVLSLGSLQTPTTENCSLVIGRWIDVTLHMLFLWYLTVGMSMLLDNVWGVQLSLAASIVSVVAVLLIENLQIPAAVLQVMLSSSRIHNLQYDYPQPASNLVPAIEVFYVLAICQGCFYITASILGLFSFFPRRMLVRQSKLRGQRGAKAIDLYYESAYSACMETGLFAARKTVSLASFAEESLSSSSIETQLAGVLLLGNLLHESWGTDSIEEMR